MPVDILLYILIAAGLVFWLHNILGTRHGDERDRSNPFLEREDPPHKSDRDEEENVISFLEREQSVMRIAGADINDALPLGGRIDNKTAENGLEEIAKKDPDFVTADFLSGAIHAFTIIVEAFAEGDRETLKSLLKPNVYGSFEAAIQQREERGESVETIVHEVAKSHIIEARLDEDTAIITVRFCADETCVIRNAEGEILSGDPDTMTHMIDVWVFVRDLSSDDPVWYLKETRDDEVEDHKTPLPETKGE